jgi:hypothetical protein
MEAKARMGAEGEDGGGGGPLGLRGLIDTIVANLELRVTNIHIRFEDPSSWPGHTFSIGVMLSEISAHTVDEDGRRAFVTNEQLRTLRKVGGAARPGRCWEAPARVSGSGAAGGSAAGRRCVRAAARRPTPPPLPPPSLPCHLFPSLPSTYTPRA